MGNKRLPYPIDDEDAGGFSHTEYLKTYFLIRKEINRILEEEHDRLANRIYDV